MKTIILFREFYCKNKLAVFVVLAIMTSSIFFMIQCIGKVSYFTYTTRVIQSAGLEESVYYMPTKSGIPETSETASSAQKSYKENLQAENFSGIQGIIQIKTISATYEEGDRSYRINCTVCDSAFLDTFRFVDEGQWLSDLSGNSPNIEAVVAGSIFSNISPGDSIALSFLRDGEALEFPIEIVGTKKEPSYVPSLSYSAPEVSASDLFNQGHNFLYIREADLEKLNFQPYEDLSDNMIVKLKSDVSEKDKRQVLDFLRQNGSYQTFDEILSASQIEIEEKTKNYLLLPSIVLFIVTYALIAVSVLLVNRKLEEQSIYYLCGCSKRRSFFCIFGAIGLVSILAGCLNILFISWYPVLYTQFDTDSIAAWSNTVISAESIIYVIGYVFGCVLISVCIPFLLIRKLSLIDFYRRQR